MRHGLLLWQPYFAACVGAKIPALAELPLSACGCKIFTMDALGDHVSTCTAHSGAKKAHDWAVEQLADLFHTTHGVKTQQVAKSRGQRCGDIELAAYLSNAAGPVPLCKVRYFDSLRYARPSDRCLH